MKWYFAISETSLDRPGHDWRGLILGAVTSARRNTTLVPHMLYDGRSNAFTAELEALGVTIIPHRVSFYDDLEAFGRGQQGYLSLASGAFLRTEIPLIETEDEIVLYTDADVLFLRDPAFPLAIPTFFAVAPEKIIDSYDDMNSGVMLINVPAMREVFPAFRQSIRANLDLGLDQSQFHFFFRNRYASLHPLLNWKPYWGVHPDAQIIHWHGPKPAAIRQLLNDPSIHAPPYWDELFRPNVERYAEHIALWEQVTGRSAVESWSPVHCVLDEVDGITARGWAIDRDRCDAVVKMQVLIDGDPFAELACTAERHDVRHAGHAHGPTCGFAVALPPLCADGRTHSLQFRDRLGTMIAIEHRLEKFGCYEFAAVTENATATSPSVP